MNRETILRALAQAEERGEAFASHVSIDVGNDVVEHAIGNGFTVRESRGAHSYTYRIEARSTRPLDYVPADTESRVRDWSRQLVREMDPRLAANDLDDQSLAERMMLWWGAQAK